METTTEFNNGSYQQSRYTYTNDHYGYNTENNHHYTNTHYNYYTGSNSNSSTHYGTKFGFNILGQNWKRKVPEDLTEYNKVFGQQPKKTKKDYKDAWYVNAVANQNLNEMLKNKIAEVVVLSSRLNTAVNLDKGWYQLFRNGENLAYKLVGDNRKLQKVVRDAQKINRELLAKLKKYEDYETLEWYPEEMPRAQCINKIPKFKTKPSKFLEK